MNSKTNGFIPISVPFLSGNEQKYLNECIKSNYVSTVGPFVNKIEKKISRLSGTKYCSAVSSGTAALQLSLLSCGIKPKELIIIPSYTFIATANAIMHAGAEPWIFDIEKNHWNLDFDQVEKILEKMTFFHNNI